MPGGLQSEPLVGRVRELEVAHHLLDAATSGRPQVLTLRGEAGIGKSRLARAIAAAATSRGAIVLWGAGQEDLSLPYLPLAMALGPLEVDRPLLAGPSARDRGEAMEPAEAWAEAADALVTAAERSLVLLVVDDLQWTDPASQALLLHLLVVLEHAATTRKVRAMTVITVRLPDDDERTGRLLSRIEREPNAAALEVGGLDRAEVRELLSIIGPAPPSAALVQSVLESTSGNPLLAQSILRRGVQEGRISVVGGALVAARDDPLPVSANEVDRSVAQRLATVSTECRDLLTVAAFLGDHQPTKDVAELAGVPMEQAEQLVDMAVGAGLLRDLGSRCSFSHPQVRHVLFSAPHQRARQRLHLRLADGIEARGGDADPLALAHHLSRAGELAAPQRLARWSHLAAQAAMRMGAWAEASVVAAQALSATTPDEGWEVAADLNILVTEAASHDFDLAAVSRHGLAAISIAKERGDASRWGRALLPLARTLLTHADAASGAAEALHLIQDYLEGNPDAEPEIRARLLSLLSEMWAASDRIDDALVAATRASQLLDEGVDQEVAAAVHVAEGLAHWARLDLRAARVAYERAVRAASDDPMSRAGVYAAVRRQLVEHLAGEIEVAAAVSPGLLDGLAAAQIWGEYALAAAAAAATALAQGRFDDVERHAAASSRSVDRSGYLWPRMIALPALSLARALRGDGVGARSAIAAMDAGQGIVRRYGLAIDTLLGDTDRVAAAVHERPLRPPTPELSMQSLPAAVLYAEVAAAIDDADMAAAALAPLRHAHERGVLLSQGWAVLISRTLAECLLTTGQMDEARRWLDTAAQEARSRSLIGEAARVALAQARLALRDASVDDNVRTRLAAEAALALDEVGALPLAATARRLGRLDMNIAEPARRAILFTDLVDSTGLNVRAGDTWFVELVREHNEVVRSCLRSHAGVEFKHTGDGIAAWFAAPADAVACATAIGSGLERVTVLHPDLPLQVRIGISVGEPIGHEGDLFGLSVVRAARLCGLAGPGEVLVTDEVVADARPDSAGFNARGEVLLKGFPEPVRVHALVPGAASADAR